MTLIKTVGIAFITCIGAELYGKTSFLDWQFYVGLLIIGTGLFLAQCLGASIAKGKMGGI